MEHELTYNKKNLDVTLWSRRAEKMPRKVTAGGTIYTGSLNHSGALTMRVTAAGEGTLIAFATAP